jgi:hypothetical protein
VTRLARYAATYARHGIAVFPCTPGAKTPLPGSRGFHDATTNPDQVDQWWRQHPNANIGAPTGLLFDVADFDMRVLVDGTAEKDPDPALDALRESSLLIGAIGVATTRHGGAHYFYPASGKTSGSLPTWRLDYKARGGYVLLPPSIVPCDPGVYGPGTYTWDPGRVLNLADPAGEPFQWDAVKALLQPPAPKPTGPRFDRPHTSGNIDGLVNWLARRSEGERNKSLHWAACVAVEDGHDPEELRDAAQRIGLDDTEITRTIQSARRAVAAS